MVIARRLIVCALAALASAVVFAQQTREPDWPRLQDETMRHFQAILRLDTSNPPGNEKRVTDYLQQALEAEGIAVQTFAKDPNRPNLVARIKGNGRKPPILFMGHTDVVTVDPKKWTFPPFSATRDGGYVYARGALDDKPHVVAGLMLMLELKRLQVPLDRDVIFLAESGEEGSSGVGIDFMASEHWPAIDAQYCFAEGGNVTRAGGRVKYAAVQTMEKVPRSIELVATGPSGHASRPLLGNAVVHLAAAVAAVGQWRVPVRLNDTTREFFSRMASISTGDEAARYRAVSQAGTPEETAADDYLRAHDPTYASMLRTSISPTIISGGYRVNVIPSEAKATLDVRMLPDENPEQFLDAVRKVINDPAVTVQFAARANRPIGAPADLNSEAFKTVEATVGKDYDTVTLPMMGTGATDMAQVRGKGAQCYGIGPASDIEDGPKGFGAHSDQERILENELYRFVRFSWDVVTALARTK